MHAKLVRLESIEGPVLSNSIAVRTYKWKRSMRLTRWFAQVGGFALGPTSFPWFSFRISNQWGWYLGTDTTNPQFLPLVALFGRSDLGANERTKVRRSGVPVNITVRSGDLWTVEIQNGTGVVAPPVDVNFPVMLFEAEDLPDAVATP